MKKLSVTIITLNEERNIERCLNSVSGLADEIVVIDSFSTDRTEQICLTYGVLFKTHPFKGYIEQKQVAVDQCTNNFILSLDADEALSEELRMAIAREKEKDFPAALYTMNRLTNYCGQWIRHGGWYPDKKLRLFDKSVAKWGGQNPHDKIVAIDAELPVHHLNADILHYSYNTVADHWRQSDKFASIAAKALASRGKRYTTTVVILKTFAKFIRNYIIKGGFLDGRNGFIISRISAWESWQRYSRVKDYS